MHIQGFEIGHVPSRLLAMAKPTYYAIINHALDRAAIVFVPSTKQAQLTAVDLLTFASANGVPCRFLHSAPEDVAPFLACIRDPALSHTIAYGIGFLHSGLGVDETRAVKALYASGAIQVLVVVHSLCWGLGLSAHLVVLLDAQHYEGAEHRYVDYPVTDVLQMMGRASRPLVDDVGRCVLLCHASKKPFYKKFLYEPLPV
jgi:pre-mRNA-splicing helicase BRR2